MDVGSPDRRSSAGKFTLIFKYLGMELHFVSALQWLVDIWQNKTNLAIPKSYVCQEVFKRHFNGQTF